MDMPGVIDIGELVILKDNCSIFRLNERMTGNKTWRSINNCHFCFNVGLV